MPEVKKSGEAVRGSSLSGGLLAVLLAPWMSMILERWTREYSVVFPAGYDQIMIAAITVLFTWVAAALKVRQIEGKSLSSLIPFTADFNTKNDVEESALTEDEKRLVAELRRRAIDPNLANVSTPRTNTLFQPYDSNAKADNE